MEAEPREVQVTLSLLLVGVRGSCTPGTAYVSSLHVRVGVCGWWGKQPPWGRHGTRVCPLPLLLPLALPPCLCVFCARGLVANWGFPRVRPHGRVDLREI